MEYLKNVDSRKGRFYIYKSLTLLYLDLKNFPLVERYLELALDFLDEQNNPYSFNELLSIQAKVLIIKGERRRYQSIMEKVIDNCIEKNLLTLVEKFSAELGEHYYHNNNYKKAAQHLLNLVN